MTLWFLAFVLTCVVELLVVRALHGKAARITVVLGAQVATHPLVWIGMATLPLSITARLFVVELGATLVEAAIYHRAFRVRAADALAISAVANAASLGVAAFIEPFL
jgi:hypothetical protein